MTQPLDITEDTYISDILDHYGDVADMMEVFGVKRAGGLAVRKVLGRLLTVRRAAVVHGVPIEKFLPMIRKAAKRADKARSA